MNTIADVDPHSEYLAYARFSSALMEGRFDDARRVAERGLEEHAGSAAWPAVLGQALALTGARAEARTIVKTRLPDPHAGGAAGLAYVFIAALDDDEDTMRRIMTPEFEGMMWNDLQYCHLIAESYAMVARRDDAMRWLQRAVDRGFLYHRLIRSIDPLFAPLRGDSRFEALCDRAQRMAEAFPGDSTPE